MACRSRALAQLLITPQHIRLNRRQWLTTLGAAAAGVNLLSEPTRSWGQSAAPKSAPAKSNPPSATPLADPRDFELRYTPGPIRPGNGRNVLYRTAAPNATVPNNAVPGKAIADDAVARLLVEIGTTRVLMLPNGRLKSLPAAEATITDKPFNPATMPQVAAELTANQFAGFKTRKTKHYLYLYNTSDPFYTATSRILETMFPGVYGYAKGQKFAVREPEVPMVVVMFHTEQEFQAFQKMPQGIAAYYSPVSNFVVMYERSRLADLAPEIALRQAITIIAHEGAHQILHNIGVQQRLSRWPIWISEGLAEYFAPTSTDKRMTWKGAGQLNELRLLELDRYLRTRPARAQGDLVKATVESAELTSTGYAAAWALTHYLAQRQTKKFFEFLREVSAIGPFEGGGRPDNRNRLPENLTMFIKHFGNDLDGLETQVVSHLQRLLAKNA